MGAKLDKIKGKAKELEGRLTGDKLRTAQGKATQTKGSVKGVAARVAAKVKAGIKRVKKEVRAGRAKAKGLAR